MLVILIRGFDLSLGSNVSLISVAVALTMTTGLADAGVPTAVLIAAGIATGFGTAALVGVFNGFCTANLHVNPFIVTLGSLGIAFGAASMISGGRPVFDLPDAFSTVLYSGKILGLSMPVWIMIILSLGLHAMLVGTVFGRSLYLIGSNSRAAAVAGVPVTRYVFLTYVLASLVVAVGAMMLTGRTGSGEPNLGGSLLLPSIAAAVVGGISLRGGTGGVGNAVVGALFISILSNGMNLIEINGYLQNIILGIVILAALYLDRFRRYH
ncbi:ABC transporter permease [Eoetvoesiella caeni]